MTTTNLLSYDVQILKANKCTQHFGEHFSCSQSTNTLICGLIWKQFWQQYWWIFKVKISYPILWKISAFIILIYRFVNKFCDIWTHFNGPFSQVSALTFIEDHSPRTIKTKNNNTKQVIMSIVSWPGFDPGSDIILFLKETVIVKPHKTDVMGTLFSGWAV